MTKELEELKLKLSRDAEQSQRRISELQKEIQELVAVRKDNRFKWEEEDAALEGDILEATNEVSGILQRKLQAEELIRHLETLQTI